MSPHVPSRSLPEVLLDHHLVTQEELDQCIPLVRADSSKSLADVLIEKEFVDEEDLVVALCDGLGMTHIAPGRCKIEAEVLSLVTETIARRHRVIPISATDTAVTVAMVDPLQLPVIDTLQRMTGREIHTVVSMRSEILQAIDHCYGDSDEETAEEPEEESELEEVEVEEEIEDLTAVRHGSEQEPVKRLVRRVLLEGIRQGASDIHIEPYEKVVALRYRIDGTLHEEKRPPKRHQSQMIARFKILAGCRIDEHRLPQDGRLRVRYEGRDIDMRVAFLPCRYGEKIVLRILDKSSLSLDLASLGFEEQPLRDLQQALGRPNGMVLITGPTGSGKTTTLYSALTKLNTRRENIVTVEDPIEYELYGINQCQTYARIGLTFAEALRQILRQDPDIVMLGEIRDHETADVAVKAALTGHLVLSTLHTNDAAGVFPRLIDMGLEPFLVQTAVVLAAAQRLLKRICDACKEPVPIRDDVLERVGFNVLPDPPPPAFAHGRGCPECKGTGYRKRVAIIEAMPNYPEVGELVLNKASARQIMQQAMACGTRSLRQNGLAKAAKGITTLAQVLEHTVEV